MGTGAAFTGWTRAGWTIGRSVRMATCRKVGRDSGIASSLLLLLLMVNGYLYGWQSRCCCRMRRLVARVVWRSYDLSQKAHDSAKESLLQEADRRGQLGTVWNRVGMTDRRPSTSLLFVFVKACTNESPW